MKRREQIQIRLMEQGVPPKLAAPLFISAKYARCVGIANQPLIFFPTIQMVLIIAILSAGLFFAIFSLFNYLVLPIYLWQSLAYDSLLVGFFTGGWFGMFFMYFRRKAAINSYYDWLADSNLKDHH